MAESLGLKNNLKMQSKVAVCMDLLNRVSCLPPSLADFAETRAEGCIGGVVWTVVL